MAGLGDLSDGQHCEVGGLRSGRHCIIGCGIFVKVSITTRVGVIVAAHEAIGTHAVLLILYCLFSNSLVIKRVGYLLDKGSSKEG